MWRLILLKLSNSKFHENLFSGHVVLHAYKRMDVESIVSVRLGCVFAQKKTRVWSLIHRVTETPAREVYMFIG
jgi:hypothetical protein